MTGQPPRVDAQRTIERILTTARDVLAEHPEASYSEIVGAVEVHRTTVGRHFPTRGSLIEALLQRSLEAIEARVAEVDLETGPATDGLRRATVAWMTEASGWRTSRYAPYGAMGDLAVRTDSAVVRLRERIVTLLERGQRDGSIRADLSPHTLYLAWASLTMTFNARSTDAASDGIADDIVTLVRGPGEPARA